MQYNPEEFKEIINVFNSECEEIMQELNNNFLELEKNTDDKTPLKRLLQLSHSLKGSARMLGFESIQDIAHKLEDILSFWKQDSVKIDKNSFQTIYETCDYITALISKCVELKADYTDEKKTVYLKNLEALIPHLKTETSDNQKKTDTRDYIKTKHMDINAAVLELIFIIGKNGNDEDDEIVSAAAHKLDELSEIFEKTNYTDIKREISFLASKTADNCGNTEKIAFLKTNIPHLKTGIYNLFKTFNLQSSEFGGKISENNDNEKKNKSNELSKQFDYILNNLQKIKYDISSAEDVIEFLKTLKTKSAEEDIVLQKLIKILGLYKTKNIPVSNDCYLVILQCIYMFKRLGSKDCAKPRNTDFLCQRLNVLEDMFNLSNTDKTPAIRQEEKNVFPVNNYSDFKRNPSGFEFQEIKTLRIDTAKLDNLISQTGELLINGIKTRNHLEELSCINSDILKWSGDSKKILNYLKYLEKRGFFTQNSDESITAFCKKVQNFFTENSAIINKVNHKLNTLYNTMFTDDGKLYQNTMEIDMIAKNMRVLPLAAIFHSFPRMIRDIAQQNGKQTEFLVSGSDTTVDKKLMEEIKMPLIHLLRNAVAHGIEKPETRKKKHKKETGIIKLSAKQAENYVIISVEDDGCGIDTEKVKEISLKKGLLTKEEVNNIDDEHLVKLLFLPGFTTSESVDEISGRGVGLDVVKTKITNLNGDIYIDSTLNKGCKITIKLPLSMSTIKTFILLSGGQKYAMPVNTIKYVKNIKKEDIYQKDGQTCILYDSHSIPVFSLSEILANNKENEENTPVLTAVIIEIQDRTAAFTVDKLIGDQEVFQKKLVMPVIKIKNISGFTTLSNGEICLILNPYELMRNSLNNDYINDMVTKLIPAEKKE